MKTVDKLAYENSSRIFQNAQDELPNTCKEVA